MSFFSRLKQRLTKTTGGISDAFRGLVGLPNGRVEEETLQELEDALILADVGVDNAAQLVQKLQKQRFADGATAEDVKQWLADQIAEKLAPCEQTFNIPTAQPAVIMFVGVNGSGKTTTIGKLASKWQKSGQKLLLAAGDTFRAGAADQLAVWADRANVPLVRAEKDGADPAGLLFQAYEQAQTQNTNILMADTAGRLQNRADLMDELAKMVRVLKKQDETAPHATLLVLDATVGQNALSQVETFINIANVTGLVITKLDSSAKAGVVLAIAEKFKLPIYYIGVGESLDDLQPFSAQDFAQALVGLGNS
ncbi:MAG: signal recognition particle-docking protein FtsY [Alphaproteobacteria bacterium]|nr:signal recognition particle-docking protein FtsY [Alphaproteobacteria bacterium]MDD9919131.1 signal recognition particle-docking protein FtsY [Alphaproteobacteria bacterium]